MLKIYRFGCCIHIADEKFVLKSSKPMTGSSPNTCVHLKIVSSLYPASGISFSKERKEKFYDSGAVYLLYQIKVSKYCVNG